jgi:hypothetical protein
VAKKQREIDRSERISDSDGRATSMTMPLAVHLRLDAMAELTAGIKSSRGELVSMLIAETELDRDQLEDRLNAYRKKRVGDIHPDPGADVWQLRAPGRPPRRA